MQSSLTNVWASEADLNVGQERNLSFTLCAVGHCPVLQKMAFGCILLWFFGLMIVTVSLCVEQCVNIKFCWKVGKTAAQKWRMLKQRGIAFHPSENVVHMVQIRRLFCCGQTKEWSTIYQKG